MSTGRSTPTRHNCCRTLADRRVMRMTESESLVSAKRDQPKAKLPRRSISGRSKSCRDRATPSQSQARTPKHSDEMLASQGTNIPTPDRQSGAIVQFAVCPASRRFLPPLACAWPGQISKMPAPRFAPFFCLPFARTRADGEAWGRAYPSLHGFLSLRRLRSSSVANDQADAKSSQ